MFEGTEEPVHVLPRSLGYATSKAGKGGVLVDARNGKDLKSLLGEKYEVVA